MERYLISPRQEGLSEEEIRAALLASLEGRDLRKVLILPPDFTRFHSNAGFITNVYYHTLLERGVQVDIMPALGTHEAVSPSQLDAMFGDIPHDRFLVHDWRHGVRRIGVVPGAFVSEVSGGISDEDIPVEVDRELLDGGYDLIVS